MMMACDDIKKKLKRFMEDLLVGEEYQAFLGHLENCSECKKYVTSIDSFSNQLWKLGDVKVPSDLSSTALFQLKQPDQEVKKPKSSSSKKAAIGVLVLILAAASIFFGSNYFKNRGRSQEVEDTKSAKVEEIKEEKPKANRKMYFDDTVIVAKGGAAVRDTSSTANTSSSKTGSSGIQTSISKPKPLHWHFVYPEVKDETQQSFNEKRRKESERKTKILNMLNTLGLSLDYKENDLYAFVTTGKKIESLLEKILSMPEKTFSMQDFTTGVYAMPDNEHSVSIYLEEKGASALHWHITIASSQQKSQLLDAIRKKSSIANYEIEKVIIFYIQRSEIEQLKTKIKAMRVGFSEFGHLESNEGQLSSGPIKISIYFTN
ncbi:zf-HC2 domain-containing protein [Candidatus Omnitrophota bacterium]